MGSDFLTDAGVRSRALSQANLIKIWDYHGSYTTWPKETYDIAKGLRRQGFGRLAIELENRLVNVVRALKAYPEFIYVDYRGRILGAASAPHRHAQTLKVNNTDRPERIQAWTASAIYAVLASRRRQLLGRQISLKRKKLKAPGSWQYDLESQILQHIPLMPQLRTGRTLSARYPSYPYQLKA
jgi:glycogen debranching enzyme